MALDLFCFPALPFPTSGFQSPQNSRHVSSAYLCSLLSEFELTGAADDDSLGITQLMATLQGRMHISCSLASASPSIFMRPEPIAALNKKYVTTNPNFSLSSFYPVDIPQSRPSRVRVSTPRNVKGGKARRFERSPSMRYSKKINTSSGRTIAKCKYRSCGSNTQRKTTRKEVIVLGSKFGG